MIEKLKMLTQEEVANLLCTTVKNVAVLRELEILPATKTGKNFMFTQDTIAEFQIKYKGKDVSNRVKAIEAMKEVDTRFTK